MNANQLPCHDTRKLFSGYLDGVISGRQMQSVAAHLEQCAGCHAEFNAWRGMQQVLAATGPVRPPEDLGLRLRLAISHENARREARWWDSLSVRWNNLLRPVFLQASAGLASALLLVGGIALLFGVVAPGAVQANDEPLGALTAPHFLYTTAHAQPIDTPGGATIVIQAKINEEGRVYDYRILSGSSDAPTDAEIRNQLMLLVYQPARAFDLPVRGEVLIAFSGISVRG